MKGKKLMQWAPPKSWKNKVLEVGRANESRLQRWLPFILPFFLLTTYVLWTWYNSDPATRVSPILMFFILIVLFAITYGLLILSLVFCHDLTVLYENGIATGYSGDRIWTPYSSIEWFFVSEESLDEYRFTLLTWKIFGSDDDCFSVIPPDCDLSLIKSCILTGGIEVIDSSDF